MSNTASHRLKKPQAGGRHGWIQLVTNEDDLSYRPNINGFGGLDFIPDDQEVDLPIGAVLVRWTPVDQPDGQSQPFAVYPSDFYQWAYVTEGDLEWSAPCLHRNFWDFHIEVRMAIRMAPGGASRREQEENAKWQAMMERITHALYRAGLQLDGEHGPQHTG